MPNGDPIYRLPPDWHIVQTTTPFSEIYDWSLEFLGIPELWKQTRGSISGKPVRVAVLDTGVDTKHKDLQDGAIADAFDFTGSRFGPEDVMGHGTHCIGMIAARAQNNLGVAGIANKCEVVSCKVLGDNGGGTDQQIEAGIRKALNLGCDFVSMSLGAPRLSSRIRGILREAEQQGVFAFAASGNDGGAVNSPGRLPTTIGVGAVDKDGKLTRFTSRGPELDILAPGQDMVSTIPGGYGKMTGTSMAAPVAAAIGVLAYARHEEGASTTPLTNIQEMREHLQRTGRSTDSGYKLIDPTALLAENGHSDDPEQGGPMFTVGGYAVFGRPHQSAILSVVRTEDLE